MNISKINTINFSGRKTPKKIAKAANLNLQKSAGDSVKLSSTKPKSELPTPPKPPESRTIIDCFVTSLNPD